MYKSVLRPATGDLVHALCLPPVLCEAGPSIFGAVDYVLRAIHAKLDMQPKLDDVRRRNSFTPPHCGCE